jgi:hypothetical protein
MDRRCGDCKHVVYKAPRNGLEMDSWLCGNKQSFLYKEFFPEKINPDSYCGHFEPMEEASNVPGGD